MDASRCVVFEFNGRSQEKETLLRYLSKNDQSYNWIVTEYDKIRACIWWKRNVEFSRTPLRSFLKRFKSKIINLKISGKMLTCEGVQKVYNGNVPVMLTLDVLRRTSNYHLTKPVRERVIKLRLLNYYMQSQKSSNEEPDNTNDVEEPTPLEDVDPEEPTPLEDVDPEEPTPLEDVDPFPPVVDNDREFKCYKYKVDLLTKITARIATEIKKLSQLIEPAEVKEDTSFSQITHADEDTSSSLITHADEDMSSSVFYDTDEDASSSLITRADVSLQPEVMDKPTPKFYVLQDPITGGYCNRNPITGECDGDPRGHLHPF